MEVSATWRVDPANAFSFDAARAARRYADDKFQAMMTEVPAAGTDDRENLLTANFPPAKAGSNSKE
jgi:hypothetical protein